MEHAEGVWCDFILFFTGKQKKKPWLVVVTELDRMSTVVEKEEHNNFDSI